MVSLLLSFLVCMLLPVNGQNQRNTSTANPIDTSSLASISVSISTEREPTILADDAVSNLLPTSESGHAWLGDNRVHIHDHLSQQDQSLVQQSVTFLYVLLILSVLAQTGIFFWKKTHSASYQLCTLVALWLIPLIYSLQLGFLRFILLWTLFTLCTLFILRQASRHPLNKTTPRLVYTWFIFLYRICYVVASVGYFSFMAEFFFGSMVSGVEFGRMGMTLLFYGLYFGLLGRDCAEVSSSRMTTSLGYYSKDGFPQRHLADNVCALCDSPLITLNSNSSPESLINNDDKIYTLNCSHQYHNFCIRGWTLIGKKDTCPYCSEKVRLREIISHPWENISLMWAFVLDAIRYLVVFNPLVVFVTHFLFAYINDSPVF